MRKVSQHTQNIQINKVTGENEKCVFYFMEKTMDFLAIPILHGSSTLNRPAQVWPPLGKFR